MSDNELGDTKQNLHFSEKLIENSFLFTEIMIEKGMDSRFSPEAAKALRTAIYEAGGVEVFAIGSMKGKIVNSLEIHCRGNENSVPALLSRSKPGQVVIHNHPSGHLRASQADMMMANIYGDNGIGVVIVNNDVSNSFWVVEPHLEEMKKVDLQEVQDFFEKELPTVMPNFEARIGQIDMALQVADAFNTGHTAILEAGTGTGKSLAYLVPSVFWAVKNDSKVAIATFTITLQSQLLRDDIPIIEKTGRKFDYSLVKGRSNYICRRRFQEKFKRSSRDTTLKALSNYIDRSQEGSRSDVSFQIEPEIWEDIHSDSEQTLRAKCPHYNKCFYYQARRRAAASHLMIINHHLLLADMIVKADTGGEGILPKFDRLVIDEGHHLEDSATSLFKQQLSARSVKMGIAPLLNRKRKAGALDGIGHHYFGDQVKLSRDRKNEGFEILDELSFIAPEVHKQADSWFQNIHEIILPSFESSKRIKTNSLQETSWQQMRPVLTESIKGLNRLNGKLQQLSMLLEHVPEETKAKEPQPMMDLMRVNRRIIGSLGFLKEFLVIEEPDISNLDLEQVRWVERTRGKDKTKSAKLCLAPIEVAPSLRDYLFLKMKAVVSCSATMTVDQKFDHYQKQVGLFDSKYNLTIKTDILPTPFDYQKQAVLVIPTDLPAPNERAFVEGVVPFIVDSIKKSRGGVFVLCTSYKMLQDLYNHCHFRLGNEYALLRQGQMGRDQLLERFIKTPNSVLFGADSFWEGVSVPGADLQMIIIPKLPFRVPTEPVQEARYERIQASGRNPFTEYSLPQAALRLRQGFGRLIRTQRDRGVVILLDKRVWSKYYGRYFLNSLPAMPHVRGSSHEILEYLHKFYGPQV